jgi:hypothetical protein
LNGLIMAVISFIPVSAEYYVANNAILLLLHARGTR